MKLTLPLCAIAICILCEVHAQTYPTGFSQVEVASGISNPTVMEFSFDGRIFIAQQNGVIIVIKNGVKLTTPALSLPVNASGERGLIGMAVHPSFSTNGWIYLYYTLPDGSRNRLSRFTFSGDVITPSSEVVLLNLDPLSSATNHNGGALQFRGPDKLFVAIGENANTAHSQNLDTYHGKILRINPDGTAPTDNPFYSATASEQRQRIWSYGLRNPYTFDVEGPSGRIFVNDVGQNTWEEINDATNGGRNFGWPATEGNTTNPAYTSPVFAYAHGSGDGRGCAITGGVFYNIASSPYPPMYQGKYFYMDLCNAWINYLDLSSGVVRHAFATGLPGQSLGLEVSRDGYLYFLSRTAGRLYRINYSNAGSPAITDQPDHMTVTEGSPATFTVSASGTAPLSYQWRKNGVNIVGANGNVFQIAAVESGDGGNYSVVVSNSVGSVTSATAVLTVTNNQSPTAEIQQPATGSTYVAGQTVNFLGSGADPEQGNNGLTHTWIVEFHHDEHMHPGPSVQGVGEPAEGQTSGSFVIPTQGETATNVFYRLILTVRDAQGQTGSDYVDILPRTSQIILRTNPSSLSLTLDGQPVVSPSTTASVEGMERAIGTVSPQTAGGTSYAFSNWAHGGSPTQVITTPVDNTTYTANFSSPLISGWRTTDVGKVNVFGSASLSNGTYTVSGSGADIYNNTDHFRFVYRSIDGDVDIRARVTGMTNTHSWAKAGVMIRRSADLRSIHAMTIITPGNIASFQRRLTSGGTSVATNTSAAAPHWVRLTRIGNTLTSYISEDGVNWTVVGSPITLTLGTRVLAGLVVTSHTNNQLCTATITNVSVSTPAIAAAIEDAIVYHHRKSDLEIYPNPVGNGMLKVSFSNELSGELQVVNILGQTLVVHSVPPGANSAELDVTRLPIGMYKVMGNHKGRIVTGAFIKK
jgi:glucose/arabinose dehydrogenase